MYNPLDSISRMALKLQRLPGIGQKTALRLAYFIASQPEEYAKELSEAIYDGRKNIHFCSVCGNYTEQDVCDICKNDDRKNGQLCVVKDPKDVAAFERMQFYKGQYHILGGTLSPMNGIGPEDIRIKELLSRLASAQFDEVILATNPDIEGEATATYISRLLKPLNIKVTRIAHGVPVGSDLEYTDEMTLLKALEGRREV